MSNKDKIEQIRGLRDAQGKTSEVLDDYMLGMYNGLELALCILEDREPEYKSKD